MNIKSKENFYELGKEYRQSAQDFAGDATKAAARGDVEAYQKNMQTVERLSNLASYFDQKVEKFNNQQREGDFDAR